MSNRQYKIEWAGTPNFTKGRRGKKIVAIVNHITAGLFPGTLSWMQNPKAYASANYLVTRTGRIFQLVKDEDTAWACGLVSQPNWPLYDGSNPNYYVINIEHEGYKDKGGDGNLTEEQYQATLWLHRHLINKHNLPITKDTIIGHYRIDSINRPNCPGPRFPWERLFNDLRREVIDMALDKWMIDGGQAAIKALADKGLLNTPEHWNTEKKLAEPVPAYLLWMMMNRLADRMEGK